MLYLDLSSLPSMRVAPEINYGGGSKIGGESPACRLHFRSARKTEFREVSNSFWIGTRREKTRLKKVTYLLSQSEQNMYFYMYLYCAFHKFSEVPIIHIGKKGRRFQLCDQFLAVFLLGQGMVIAQMSLYIELDRHS